jgi:hypothetical protein
MAHWAEIDLDNKVTRVLVGDNNDPAGDEGYQWLLNNLGGTWIKTSYNNNIRGTYAGIGYSYNESEDIFIAPQPYPSWVRTGSFWEAPVLYPIDGLTYSWNEAELQWDVIDFLEPQA